MAAAPAIPQKARRRNRKQAQPYHAWPRVHGEDKKRVLIFKSVLIPLGTAAGLIRCIIFQSVQPPTAVLVSHTSKEEEKKKKKRNFSSVSREHSQQQHQPLGNTLQRNRHERPQPFPGAKERDESVSKQHRATKPPGPSAAPSTERA